MLQTASTEDITLRVERITAAAGEELVFETDGGRENEFLLRATDPGEDQGENGGSGDGDNSGNGDGSGGKMETAEIPETKGVPGMTAPAAMETALTEILAMAEITAVPEWIRKRLRRQLPPCEEHRLYLSPGICQRDRRPVDPDRERTGSSGFLAARWLWTAGSLRAANGTIWGADGLMDRGWHYQKETGSWYYLRENGAMKKGWIQLSGIWYYLGTADGRMAVGWQSIGEKWYYLNPAEPVPVPATDPVTGQTVQSTEGQLPYGAMYQNRKTSRRLHDRSRRSLDGIGNVGEKQKTAFGRQPASMETASMDAGFFMS